MKPPIVAETVQSLRKLLAPHRAAAKKIGFFPTLGGMHEGHLALIRRARAESDILVVSIFVNPTQFGPGEDYRRYPRNLKTDLKLCAQEGVDYAFVPSVEEIYPDGFVTYVVQEKLTEKLCGASRPGHFRGVTTVVAKLFNIVQPDVAYFGQKDPQQAAVIRRMVADLNLPIRIVVCPTVREPDGLAMSTRNQYLSPEDRQDALCLYHSLAEAKRMIESGETDPRPIMKKMSQIIENSPSAKLDYVAIVDPESLEDIHKIDRRVLVAVAAWIGRARLIDNMLLSPPSN